MTIDRNAVKAKAKAKLWLRSGGRCEYAKCNKPLWEDSLTLAELNESNIAHIHGVAESSARHLPNYEDQVDHFENLMLMCYDHHHLIDDHEKRHWPEHSADALRKMKKDHEDRIEHLTGLKEDSKSEVLIYGRPLGVGQPIISSGEIYRALQPNRYPASKEGITLRLLHQLTQPYTPAFWQSEESALRYAVSTMVTPRLRSGEVNHLSVFAICEQPLLVLLGHLISDQVPTVVYPRIKKETDPWGWLEGEDPGFDITINRPDRTDGPPALVFSFSATVTSDRVTACFQGEIPCIWEMTIPTPSTDWLHYRNQLDMFCRKIRELLNEIKTVHGHDTLLHVFPAAPIPINIELGRQHKANADMPMLIYNHDYSDRTFKPAITVSLAAGDRKE